MKRFKHCANIVSVENSTYTISEILCIRPDGDCDGLFVLPSFHDGLDLLLFIKITDEDGGDGTRNGDTYLYE